MAHWNMLLADNISCCDDCNARRQKLSSLSRKVVVTQGNLLDNAQNAGDTLLKNTSAMKIASVMFKAVKRLTKCI